jgi:CBS domain-containing protein
MSQQPAYINAGQPYRKRPGPFGPAWALLPKNQEPLVVAGDTPAFDVLERMVDHNFSQVPVENEENRIVGVFTWKSFSKRVCDLRSANKTLKPIELPVREFLEPAKFIDPDVYIDTETDWADIDHVLVGDETRLVGILSISDALGRLNDYAEAFVLIYEIEHEVRDLVRDLYSAEELAAQLQAITASAAGPSEAVCGELRQLQKELGNKPAIGKAIKLLGQPHGFRSVASLEDLSFSQYKALICSVENWPRFLPVFDTMREILDADFDRITDLRNIVFHFRRAITPKDTDRLRRFRDKVRYNREVFVNKCRSAELTPTKVPTR